MKAPDQKYRNRMALFLGAVIYSAWLLLVQFVRRDKRKRKETQAAVEDSRTKRRA